MATLSNPTFQVDILTGMPNDYRVRGTVNLELTQFETFLINAGLPLRLESNIWSEDAGEIERTDDLLFSFSSQSITAPGTYQFEAIIPRGILNEDSSLFDNSDEIYNRFSLVSGTNLFQINVAPINSPIITGRF
jgi:hypothetical protein